MGDSRDLIERYAGASSRVAVEDEQPSFDAGERYAAMLDCVLAGGDRAAFPYSMLLRATLNPSTGIELVFSGAIVTIKGRKLGDLYRAIIQHRATSVQVKGEHGMFTKGCTVDAIEIELIEG